jgi:hypothetical protein
MNIFFDVDETILGYDGSLRPLVKQVFQTLVEEGHRIYVWSGVRTADMIRTEVIQRFQLEAYVTDCYRKPLFDYLQQWLRSGVGVRPDFVVDDYPDIVEAFGGILVKPYTRAQMDGDLERVYQAIKASAAATDTTTVERS